MNNRKILITGVSGALGGNLAFYYKDRNDVAGVFRNNLFTMQGVKTIQTDLTISKDVERMFEGLRPDVVIHCAALIDMDFCENFPDAAYSHNVLATQNIMNALKRAETMLVFISTDYVYDDVGEHKEDDLPKPVNEYGRSKLMAEKIALNHKNSLVLRTTFFGLSIGEKKTYVEKAVANLKQGQKVKGFQDAFSSPIYIGDLSRIIELAVDKGIRGVFNVGSRDGLSKYELLRRISRSIGQDERLVEPNSVDSIVMAAKRNKNAVMNVRKISRALGMDMPSISETVARFAADIEERDYLNNEKVAA